MYSITGNESSDELLDLIVSLAGEENDALEREIMQLMGADHERSISEEQQRKFRNLKVLVLWLQLADQFGRYCYYGCYCLPEGKFIKTFISGFELNRSFSGEIFHQKTIFEKKTVCFQSVAIHLVYF